MKDLIRSSPYMAMVLAAGTGIVGTIAADLLTANVERLAPFIPMYCSLPAEKRLEIRAEINADPRVQAVITGPIEIPCKDAD